MKRVKIMLTAIGVLAVVGGAVAFKARTTGQTEYCFTTNTAAGARCPVGLGNSTIASGSAIKYVNTDDPLDCTANNQNGEPCSTLGGQISQ